MKEREYTDAEVEKALLDSPATNLETWKAVESPYEGAPSVAVSIRLPKETVALLRREAKRRGIGHTELARMLIMEGLRQADARGQEAVAGLEARVRQIEERLGMRRTA
jgi:hypothetical protein